MSQCSKLHSKVFSQPQQTYDSMILQLLHLFGCLTATILCQQLAIACVHVRCAKVAFQRMMEVLQRGSATRLPALAILQAIFEVCVP